MVHYICTGGCGGVSDKPGVCQAALCPKHGQPLVVCDCTDGKHYGKLNAHEVGEEEKEKEKHVSENHTH